MKNDQNNEKASVNDQLKPDVPGKGDTSRISNKEKFDTNFDRIFGNKKDRKDSEPT